MVVIVFFLSFGLGWVGLDPDPDPAGRVACYHAGAGPDVARGRCRGREPSSGDGRALGGIGECGAGRPRPHGGRGRGIEHSDRAPCEGEGAPYLRALSVGLGPTEPGTKGSGTPGKGGAGCEGGGAMGHGVIP